MFDKDLKRWEERNKGNVCAPWWWGDYPPPTGWAWIKWKIKGWWHSNLDLSNYYSYRRHQLRRLKRRLQRLLGLKETPDKPFLSIKVSDDFGCGVSIDDIVAEKQYTYLAEEVEWWKWKESSSQPTST